MAEARNYEEYRAQVLDKLGVEYELEDIRNFERWRLKVLEGLKDFFPTEQVETAVSNWLDDHPEATTTITDGAVTTAKVADGSVTDAKLASNGVKAEVADIRVGADGTTYASAGDAVRTQVSHIVNFEKSKNLFNGEYETGYWSYATRVESDLYCKTIIQLSAGDYLFSSTKSEFGAVNGQRVWLLTDRGGIASYIDSTVIGSVTEGTIYANRDVCSFHLDSVATVGLNVGLISHATPSKAQVSNFMLVRGTTIADFGTYEAYFEPNAVLKDDVVLTEAMVTEVNGLSGLLKKKAIFDGDSLCAGTSVGNGHSTYGYGWAGRIGIANQMQWVNYGLDGGVITSLSNPSITSSHSVVDNIDTMYQQHPDADYIIFEGGTNDADQLGNATSDPSVLGTYSESDYSGTYDTTTFTGALETIFYKATNYWKGKHIGFIVAHKMGRYVSAFTNRRVFFERAILICKKWGIPCLDLWNGCYLNLHNPNCWNSSLSVDENIAQGYLYTDAQHLTAKGYDYISPIIEDWMKSI